MYKEIILNVKFFVDFTKSPRFEDQPGLALSLNRDAESV
jgi:hypothetical protein